MVGVKRMAGLALVRLAGGDKPRPYVTLLQKALALQAEV